MKIIFWSIFFIILITGLWGFPIYSLVTKEKSINQQLIDDKIELKIVVSEQSNMIETQTVRITELEAKHEEIFKAALEVAGENYALHKVIDDMVISMKQMIEYIQKLEEELQDRDA